MDKHAKEFFYRLLETPSPSGFETRVQALVREYVKPFADTITTDLHGNVIVGVNSKATRRVMLAGHCDQIGFMVRYISNDGFLYVAPIGGVDAGVLLGARVTVYTEKGPIDGVIGRKPIHHQSADERTKIAVDLEKVWVDIGGKNKKDVERRVKIGDPVTFRLGVSELTNDLVSSPGLDDKSGLFVALETLRLCAKMKLNVGLYAVSTVQEEVGLRGARTAAYSIDPEVGIAIDVTFASDNPGNENAKAIPCKLGAGPCITHGPNTNPVVEKLLIQAAKKAKIKYQPAAASAPLGNDANAIQVSRAGVATASIGIPNRYMHTQAEVCSLADIENAAKLLAGFVGSIGKKTSFIPL